MNTAKLRDRLMKLHALVGSANANERDAALAKINELLAKHKMNWNDLQELLFGGAATADDDPPPSPAKSHRAPPASLDLIRHILKRHLHLTEHQFVAVSLWIAHTFIFARFSVTPRLVITSPTMGCGKTSLLEIIATLGFKAWSSDNLTAAVLFRRLDHYRSAVLIDEGDNQDLLNNGNLAAVLNGGWRRGKTFARYLNGEIVEFSIFAPLAIATIGTRLQPQTLQRSIIIHMERNSADLIRFDPRAIPEQLADCKTVYDLTYDWITQCALNPDPELPEGLINRPADNWRVLIAIADACNEEWGLAAREAAIEFSKGLGEDYGVLLLADIRGVFDRQPKVDRLSSAAIVAELNEMPDAPWSEWRGPRGDQSPRRLSQAQMALILRPFGIHSKSIWPLHRGATDKSTKGYLRSDFSAAWQAYCDGGTPAQPSHVRKLRIS